MPGMGGAVYALAYVTDLAEAVGGVSARERPLSPAQYHSAKTEEGSCRGPAPVDPGNLKWGRRRRGSGNNCLIKR